MMPSRHLVALLAAALLALLAVGVSAGEPLRLLRRRHNQGVVLRVEREAPSGHLR